MRLKLNSSHLHKESLLSEKSCGIYAIRIANALLTSHLHSHLAETLVLILEYAQLMSQAILLYPDLYSEKENNYYESYPLIRGTIYAAKLINPSYFLSFEEDRDLTETVILIILVLLIVKYCLCIYMFYKILFNRKPNPIMMQIFRWIHATQSRVLYYFASSFFFRAMIAHKENDFRFIGNGKTGNLMVCLIVISFEFFLGIASKARLYYVLPTKSLLASKDNTAETITLLQKFIIQLLQLCLSESAIATRWIVTVINFLLTVLRAFQYFTGLPLYKIKGLLLQGSLVGLVTALHFSGLMHLIFLSTDVVHEDLKFLLLSWIILGLLSIQLSQNLIKKLVFKVLIQNNLSCELLVHKIEMIKQCLKRVKFSTKLTQNNDWFYLLFASLRNNSKRVFDLESKADFFEKSEKITFFVDYLEKLLAQYPKSKFIKLYLAFYYAKKFRNYARAIAFIHELQKEFGSRLYLNASVLLSEIQADLKSTYTTGKSQFDLYTFAQSQKSIEKLKGAITKQVDLQSMVCEELLNSNPDLNKIFQDAQSAYGCKQEALKRIKKLMNVIPQYNVSPLVFCAYYNLIVNQSPTEYEKLCEVYYLRKQKYQRYFRKETFCEENLYEGNCALFLISGFRGEIGKIFHCNSSVKRVCGGDPERYIGAKIYHKICSPSLRIPGEVFYRSLAETEAMSLYDKTLKSYILHQEGFIFEGDFYLNTYPSVTRGFLLALFIRPKPDNRDFIIVRENGEIEGASRRICKRFGILQPEGSKKFHINQICTELGRVNNAMNTVSSFEKDNIKYDVPFNVKSQLKENLRRAATHKFEMEEAKDLYSLYTEIGNEVCLNDVGQDDTFNYFCKASNLMGDPFILRIFNLQEVDDADKSEYNHQEIIEEIPILGGEIESEKTTDLEEFDVEGEEKEEGWIDFDILHSKLNEHQEDPKRKKKKSEFQRNTTKGTPKLRKNTETDWIQKQQQDTTERNGLIPVPVPVKIAESVANSTSSRKSNSRGIFEAMKMALEAKNNSKYFIGSLLFSLVLLIGIIYIEVGLYTNLDQTIQSLSFKKDIMNYSQLRGFNILNLQTVIRTIYDIRNGEVLLQEYGRVGVSLPRFVEITREFIEELTLANKNLLSSISLLDENQNKIFYVQNVEIMYPDSTRVMDNFQAVDTLIQAGLQMIHLAETNQSISSELFEFLNKNMMNDVLVKNYQISEMTVSSVQNEVDHMQYLNSQYYIYVYSATCLTLSFLCLIIWLLYKGEKKNLTQLTKLSHSGIESILEQYKSFKVNLLENDKIPSDFSAGGGGEVFALKGVHSTKKAYSSSPRTSNLQKRFLFYGMKATALPLILAAALIGSLVFLPSSIDYLNTKLNKMSFMNLVAGRCSVLTSASVELPIGNGTYYLWNYPLIPAMNSIAEELSENRGVLVSSFLGKDLLENKEISQLLFGDGCLVFGPSMKLYCDILNTRSMNSSLAQMLGAFETLLIERTKDYENCDKSEDALRRNRLLNYELLFTLRRAMSESSLSVVELLDEEFENKLEFLKVKKISGLCRALGSLFVVFAVLWVLVMRPIRESDNNFKRVLQIFPAKMILSNFLLKMFLLKTSSLDINLKTTLDL